MYNPPINARDIPTDYLPEWFINASRTCLIPNMDYKPEEAEKKETLEKDQQKPLEKRNIATATISKGQLLTLSVIAKERDVVKCYLYFNATRLYNMKWNNGENENFMKNEQSELDELIKRMKKITPII